MAEGDTGSEPRRWCGICFAWRTEKDGRCSRCGNAHMRGSVEVASGHDEQTEDEAFEREAHGWLLALRRIARLPKKWGAEPRGTADPWAAVGSEAHRIAESALVDDREKESNLDKWDSRTVAAVVQALRESDEGDYERGAAADFIEQRFGSSVSGGE